MLPQGNALVNPAVSVDALKETIMKLPSLLNDADESAGRRGSGLPDALPMGTGFGVTAGTLIA